MLRLRSCKKLWLLVLLPLMHCQQKQKQSDQPKPAVKETKETSLVELGDSSQGAFSPDGKRLLFVSRGRPGHQQAQIYEKDLESGTETRITFQNGDTAHPVYGPKEEFILYASSTDELKEDPPLLYPKPKTSTLPAELQVPSEIYLHSLKGLEIQRLTDHPGFDGEPQISGDGKTIFWTRVRGDRTEVISLSRASRAQKVLRQLGTNPALYAASPNGLHKAWIDWDASFGVGKLKLQKGSTPPVEIAPDSLVPKADLFFSANSRWFLWSQNNQLWAMDLETNCARALTENQKLSYRHPVLSPDGERLVYTIQEKGRSRIAWAAFRVPTGPCVATP